MIGCTMYERMVFPEIVGMVGDILPLIVMVKQDSQIMLPFLYASKNNGKAVFWLKYYNSV